MRSLLAMVRKEMLHIRRDAVLIVFVLGFPLMIMVLFGYALRLKVEHMTIAVSDQDHTYFSASIKERLQRGDQFRVLDADSEQTIRDWLKSGTVRLGIVIPKDFTKHLLDNEQSVFPLLVDGTMPTLALTALHGMGVLTDEKASDELRFEDPDHPSPPTRKPPIRLDQTILFNAALRDSDFFLPGTIGTVIMLVVLILSIGLVREKEQQTIEQLLVTPISRFALIVGKLIPYGIFAFVDFIIVVAFARGIFDLPLRVSMPAMAILAGVFIVSLLALGALISTVSQTQQQAHFINTAIIVLSVLMSGLVFPIEAIPRWLQPVAWCLPMTYFTDAMRGLTLKGTTLLDHQGDYLILTGFAIGLTVVALARFRKQLA